MAKKNATKFSDPKCPKFCRRFTDQKIIPLIKFSLWFQFKQKINNYMQKKLLNYTMIKHHCLNRISPVIKQSRWFKFDKGLTTNFVSYEDNT
jgi:hypothetical protein